MAQRSADINVMVRAAEKAARRLKRDFGEVENLQVSKKGPADFVSAADLKAEETIREELVRSRPGYSLLMEESGATAGAADSDRRWIVDPLDGTTNFLHGLPHFAISIGLEERGEIIAGMVFDPIKDDLFYAEKGRGAYWHDRRIRVSGRSRLDECLIATGSPFKGHGDRGPFLAELDSVMTHTAGMRRWGTASLDLAYVAAGRFDAFWEWGLSPWDMAAGVILVREAGGLVSQVNGAQHKLDSPSLLVGSGEAHPAMVKLLREAKSAAA